jgi:hypothetical protein
MFLDFDIIITATGGVQSSKNTVLDDLSMLFLPITITNFRPQIITSRENLSWILF